jgi:hypothetical protein
MIGYPDGGVPLSSADSLRVHASSLRQIVNPGSVTHQSVPSGTAHQWPLFQALRTWTSASSVESLPSFCPFGTTNRHYLSTFSNPHHYIKIEDEDDDEDEDDGSTRTIALGCRRYADTPIRSVLGPRLRIFRLSHLRKSAFIRGCFVVFGWRLSLLTSPWRQTPYGVQQLNGKHFLERAQRG